MAQPLTIIDAPGGHTVRHGSQLVTFNLAGTLVAEEINWHKGFASIDFQDHSGASQVGVIKSAAYSSTKAIGSMTVQLKSATTVIFPGELVTIGATGFTGIKFLVNDVGIAYTQNGATKVQVQIAEWLTESPLPQINAYDGDFATAKPCGPFRFSNPIPLANSSVYKQKYRQLRSTWVQLPLDTAGPFPNTYLVEETELEDTGIADVVTWDRVYSNLPSPWTDTGVATKVRKTLFKQWTNGNLSAVSIGSHSDQIRCDIKHWYYRIPANVPSIPGVPDIAVNSVGVFTWVDPINGFPFNAALNSPPDTNNFYSFISGSVQPYMGLMRELILIYGN